MRAFRGRKTANGASWTPFDFWLLAPVSIALCLTVAAYPGRWTPDTASQAAEVRTGVITDWYGPLFNALLRLPYAVLPHFGLLLGLQLLLLGVSAFVIARQVVGSAASTLIALICLLYAPILGWSVVLSRDVWYGAFLLSFGAAVAVWLYGGNPRLRHAGLFASVCFFILALATRQNGFVGTFPVVAFAAGTCLSRRTRPTVGVLEKAWGRFAAVAAVAIAIVSLFMVVSRLVVYEVIDARRTYVDQALYVYDLSAVSQRLGENQFDGNALPARSLPRLVRQFDPDNIDSVLWGSDALFQLAKEPDSVHALRDSWIHMVRDEPASYVAARTHIFSRLLGVTAPAVYTYQPLEGSRPLAEPAFEWPNDKLDAYLKPFEDSLLQRPFLYYLAIIAFAVIGWRHGGPARLVASLGIGVLLYGFSFAFLATTVGNRFSWIAFVMGVISAILLVGEARRALHRVRRSRSTHCQQPSDARESVLAD